MTFDAPVLNFTANGPVSGPGDGGSISITSPLAKLKTTAKASLSANAATNGIGNANANAIMVQFGATDVEIGNDAGQFAFAAKGGKTSGNGGKVEIFPNPGNVNVHNTLATTFPIDVSAIGTTGDGGIIRLFGGPNVTFAGTTVALKADGGTTSGNGGEIHILGNGTVDVGSDVNTVALSARARGTSNPTTKHGGTIEIAYSDVLNVKGAGLDISSAGNAAGGEINIRNIGKFTLTGTLRADAAGTGRAGTVNITQTGYNTMTLTDSTITASGKCDTSGNCGVINIISPVLIEAGAATIRADGFLNSNAGRIGIVGNIDKINLDAATVSASSNASGNGDGGSITISTNTTITTGSSFTANGAGTGKGGTIQIIPGTEVGQGVVQLVGVISAQGGPSGNGGVVQITNVQQIGADATAWSINTHIFAKAGPSVISTSADGGVVALNGVTCRWRITTYNWPKGYWNCVNPTSPSATDTQVVSDAATKIPVGLQAGQTNTNLYVLVDSAQWNKFLGTFATPEVGGATFRERDNPNSFNMTIMEHATFNGIYTSIVGNQLTEATIHEFGHADDFAQGSVSSLVPYLTKVQKDIDHINSLGAPCQAGNAGPFNGVIDHNTSAQFCSGATLNNPGGIYTGKTNAQIASISTYFMAPSADGSWGELYAQAFVYQDYVKGLPNQTLFFPTNTANGLFQKGLYACVQQIAAQRIGVSYTPPYICN